MDRVRCLEEDLAKTKAFITEEVQWQVAIAPRTPCPPAPRSLSKHPSKRSKSTHNESYKFVSKNLPYEMTDNERKALVNKDVKEHFKKKVPEKDAPIEPGQKSFLYKDVRAHTNANYLVL